MNPNRTAIRAGIKDIWNAYMCEGARFTESDIPVCPTIVNSLPTKIITWEEAKQIHKTMSRKNKNYHYDAYICFYLDDYKFDGVRKGIWAQPVYALSIIAHFSGIITPDFSTYQDFPLPLKIYNTYRMRAFGYWIGKKGIQVINNVRWGTKETYWYCFDGIERNSVVAIGTSGGSPRRIKDRERFNEGFSEMIARLSPKTIIVYGSANYPCFDLARDKGISVRQYPSATASYDEVKKHEQK